MSQNYFTQRQSAACLRVAVTRTSKRFNTTAQMRSQMQSETIHRYGQIRLSSSHLWSTVLLISILPYSCGVFAPQSRSELQVAVGSCLEQSQLPTSDCSGSSPDTLKNQLRVASWNVLANWWYVFKYYKYSDSKAVKSWPHRKELTKHYIMNMDADILTLQEVNPQTFKEDFSFMRELGYDSVMEESSNKWMRCAIFWRRNKLVLAQVEHRPYKCQIAQLEIVKESSNCESGSTELIAQKWLFVLTCHLSASDPTKRVRELHDVMLRTEQMRKKGNIQSDHVALVLTGDLNTFTDIANSPVRRFLLDGTIGPDYNAKYPEYPEKLDLRKVKTHKQLDVRDGMADIYGSHENVPKTLIVPDLGPAMQHPDGTFLLAFDVAVQYIFETFSSDGLTLNHEDVERWISTVHGPLEQRTEDGPQLEKFARRYMEDKELLPPDRAGINQSELHDIYAREFSTNPWSVSYDFDKFGVSWQDFFHARPPLALRLDYIFYSASTVSIAAAEGTEWMNEMVDWAMGGKPNERSKDRQQPLPNEWHPSDHFAVIATVTLLPVTPAPTTTGKFKKKWETKKPQTAPTTTTPGQTATQLTEKWTPFTKKGSKKNRIKTTNAIEPAS